jgi:ribosomal protein S18 acetylase RimI-like enzyme
MNFSLMTPGEYAFWINRAKTEYAEDKMKANGYSREEAQEISEKSFKELLPHGLESPNNFLFTLKNEEALNVGFLWFAVKGTMGNQKAFIYDIVVEEQFRNKGYGRRALELLDLEAKKLGLKEIGLHVFEFNKTAIHLYESHGYQTTDRVMSKSI